MNKKIMVIVLVIALVIVAAGGVWYFYFFARGCNPILPQQKLTINGNSWTAEMATTMAQQSCGLSGREGLGKEDGMYFAFNSPGIQNFWMKDMNFPIDMIWISDNKVVGFAQDAAPQPGAQLWQLKIYTSPYGVDKVFEVPAGTVAKYNIKVGDAVTLFP